MKRVKPIKYALLYKQLLFKILNIYDIRERGRELKSIPLREVND